MKSLKSSKGINWEDESLSSMKNEKGFVMVTTLLFLALMTVIGIATINTSSIETMIAVAEKNRQKAFYAAEAGIAHCTAILMNRMSVNFKKTSSSSWDFALNDSEPGVESTDYLTDDDDKESFIWIKGKSFGSACTYTVMVRDNNDGDSDISKDDDGQVYVTSIATMADGATAGIEIGLSGLLDGGSATGYSAQAGAGSGKSYRADDAGTITNFAPQTAI